MRDDFKRLHPEPIKIFRLWQTYLDCVYPLTMIFHAPTVQQQILDASADLENVPESTEALMFAIYYAAVVALPPEDCQAMFGLPQPAVVNKYLLATQQALNAAKVLKNLDTAVLQALVILLVGQTSPTFAEHSRADSISEAGITPHNRSTLHVDSLRGCYPYRPANWATS